MLDALFKARQDQRLAELDRSGQHDERRAARIDEVWRRLCEATKALEIMLPPMMLPRDEDVKACRAAAQAYRDYVFENERYFTTAEFGLLRNFDREIRRAEELRQHAKIFEPSDVKESTKHLVEARAVLDREVWEARQKIVAEFKKANPAVR